MKSFKISMLLVLALTLTFISCSQQDQKPNPIEPNAAAPVINVKDRETPSNALTTATAQVSVKGPTYFSYTVQILQNGVLRAQNTGVTLPAGYRIISFSGLPAGCDYIANVWVNGIGVQSHTWPSKCISGTTHLGCLQFDTAGDPSPWTGSCP